MVMGMLSEQVTTTYNTHEMKSIIFSRNIWPRSKTLQVQGQNKKINADVPDARKMATSNIICLFAKYLWRAIDTTESTSINNS